jgi:hypothetical protein
MIPSIGGTIKGGKSEETYEWTNAGFSYRTSYNFSSDFPNGIRGMDFSWDGKFLFVTGYVSNVCWLRKYELSDPWYLWSRSKVQSLNLSDGYGGYSSQRGMQMAWTPDGRTMKLTFYDEAVDKPSIGELEFDIPYDLTSRSGYWSEGSDSSDGGYFAGLAMSPALDCIITCNAVNDDITKYTMNPDTLSFYTPVDKGTLAMNSRFDTPIGITINRNGKQAFITGDNSSDAIYFITMATPFDIRNAVAVSYNSIASYGASSPRDILANLYGDRVLVANGYTIYEFSYTPVI